jgi:hypothetical protein
MNHIAGVSGVNSAIDPGITPGGKSKGHYQYESDGCEERKEEHEVVGAQQVHSWRLLCV